MAWREKPLPQNFVDYVNKESIASAPCRFCDHVAEKKAKMLAEMENSENPARVD